MSGNTHPSETGRTDEKLTYGHQEVRAGEAGLVPGAVVTDEMSPDRDNAIVLDVFEKGASDVYVDVGDGNESDLRTVAELNPEYPSDDTVVKVAFVPALMGFLPGWRTIDRALLGNKVRKSMANSYDYPASRLEVVENE